VIIVAVGQYNAFDTVYRYTQLPVLSIRLCPTPLESSAVYEETPAIYLKYMPGTGHFLSRAEEIKGDIHENMII
jgi:hypothetical protein